MKYIFDVPDQELGRAMTLLLQHRAQRPNEDVGTRTVINDSLNKYLVTKNADSIAIKRMNDEYQTPPQ